MDEVLELLHPKFGAAGLSFDSNKAAAQSKHIFDDDNLIKPEREEGTE